MASDSQAAKDIVQRLGVKGVTSGEVNDIYDQIADVYDDLYWDTSRCDVFTKHVTRLLPNKESRILDIAAGTGLAGVSLKELGYTNIDALEPAEQMLAKAKERGIYANTYLEYVGAEQTSLTAGSYDAIVILGAFAEGHVTQECFPEIIRLLKDGGYLLTVIHHTLAPAGINDEIKKYEERGDWINIIKTTHPNYFQGDTATTYVFQKPAKK